MEVTFQVVNSVKGDPNHGENSPMFAACGYIRKDDRKTGLTRKSGDAEPVVKAA
jgi:hypothetical protein